MIIISSTYITNRMIPEQVLGGVGIGWSLEGVLVGGWMGFQPVRERGEKRRGKREKREERRGKKEDRRMGPTCHVDAMLAHNNPFNTV